MVLYIIFKPRNITKMVKLSEIVITLLSPNLSWDIKISTI